MKKIIYVIAFFALQLGFAQDFSGTISSYLDNNKSQLNLETQDFELLDISTQSFSKSMQVTNVYVAQQYQGIGVFNSTSSFAIKNNEVIYAKMAFVSQVASKINTTTPIVSAQDAISQAATALGLQSPSGLNLLETVANNSYVFTNGEISLNDIPVKLVFQKTEQNTLKLAWELSIYLLDASHYYNVRVDAVSGQLLETNDWVVSCNFENNAFHNANHNKSEKSILFSENNTSEANLAGGAQYRVFEMPIESPNHGSDALIADPSDPNASQFGWHDTDGAAGAEFTITRGNNVWAQEDINGNNGVGASPDGGGGLTFDFPYDFTSNPVNMVEAATVNLFYWNNIMHDVWYQYGFDEDSGNFQENNYGSGGNGSDSVNADAQDGSGTNNANFATPSDGGNPRMQMFLWSGGGAGPIDILTINNGPLAGEYTGVPAIFGGPIPVPPLTEDIVVIEDDNAGPSTDTNDGCDNITNPGDLDGKIVIIRRGECEFGFKALGAQDEGAVAVIIVNNVAGEPIPMAPGDVGDQVTIPLFMVSDIDGNAIIAELNGGGSINGTINGENVQPDLDGDVDNAIIAHEYGHGISNRLTGGPNNTNCLNNAEQMGEGWSDWFGLMLTIEPGDQGEDRRGIGTYVSGQPTTGNGIRNFPYSTDMSIQPRTYANLPATGGQPHAVGEIWAAMIWDLSWALIDQYGFDADFYNGSGGNNIAMQLVIDGLKLQGCAPGFVDGRDAILQADFITSGGANCELIWDVFARRGLGFSASQGSSNSTSDGTVAFDVPEDCLLGTNDQGLNNNFDIYPNPSNGEINIQSHIDLADATIIIYDINGRKVFTENVEMHNTTSINASSLDTGVYILQINGDNYNHTAKLIIE